MLRRLARCSAARRDSRRTAPSRCRCAAALLCLARATFSLLRRVSQALAGLLAEQGHSDEALAVLNQSLALWLPPAEAGAAEERDESTADLPSLEFRFDTAKLLLDLDHSTDTAVRVLEARAPHAFARGSGRACESWFVSRLALTRVRRAQGLLEECDDRPDVWHLLALAHHGACAFERARNCLDEAEEVRTRPPRTRRRFASDSIHRSCLARCPPRTGIGWRASWCSCAPPSTPVRRRGWKTAARARTRKKKRTKQSPLMLTERFLLQRLRCPGHRSRVRLAFRKRAVRHSVPPSSSVAHLRRASA